MTVQDLTRDQFTELKCFYYSELVNEGIFGEIIGRDYDEPSYYDLAFVDDIVSDEFIFKHYEGMIFSEDDFFCSCGVA